METIAETLYTASLNNFSSVPLKDRILAETRYCTALEKALGGADGVATAYLAWCTAAKSEQAEISAETANLATRWAKASEKARVAGLQGLSDGEGAYFEVRLS